MYSGVVIGVVWCSLVKFDVSWCSFVFLFIKKKLASFLKQSCPRTVKATKVHKNLNNPVLGPLTKKR